MVNATLQYFLLSNEISTTCWNWCAEQTQIHQSNIDISNLGVVAVAMVALLLYNISIEFQEELIKYFKWDRNMYSFAGHALVFFAFILLALFLIYYAVFN